MRNYSIKLFALWIPLLASCQASPPVTHQNQQVARSADQEKAIQLTSEHSRYLNWIDQHRALSVGVACLPSGKASSSDGTRILELKARADFVSKLNNQVSGTTHFDSQSPGDVTQDVQTFAQGYASKGEITDSQVFRLPEGNLHCSVFQF